MLFQEKNIVLKNQQLCVLRNPKESDAENMNEYLKICASETNFILRYPEECNETIKEEAEYLKNLLYSNTNLMIVALVNDEIAGNCQIQFKNMIKTKHRASIAIGLISKYWNQGIGTALFIEMIKIAREMNVTQLELEYIEGNERARVLYEKMGFQKYGERPHAICLKDGTFLKEILMRKEL